MARRTNNFEVVVVGAGSAGAAAAWLLAKQGRQVALIEARALQEAGARWINGVPPWMFDSAGIPRPQPPEALAPAGPFTVLGPAGQARLSLADNPVWGVDMPLLVARLQRLARDAGVTLFEHTRAVGLILENDRPARIQLETVPESGRPRRPRKPKTDSLSSQLFVDASGMRGALRTLHPLLSRQCLPSGPADSCTAAQEVREVRDRHGAEAFLEKVRGRPGETLAWTGIDGGFSTLAVQVHQDIERVDLLSGSIADGAHLSGTALLEGFLQQEPWIGARISGGAGVVPLRRPYELLWAPGLALLGDAACQVYAIHASGTGLGLIAARRLAEALLDTSDPGSAETLWRYQTGFLGSHGGGLAMADAFRRATQTLSGEDIERLIGAGLLQAELLRAGLDQKLPKVTALDFATLGLGVTRAPVLAHKLAPHLARMALALGLFRAHPRRPGARRFEIWSGMVRRLFGET